MKILVVSGERRGESAGRSKYNEMEIHRTNATVKAHRLVHQWRPVIDYSEKDVCQADQSVDIQRSFAVIPGACLEFLKERAGQIFAAEDAAGIYASPQ